MKEEFVNYEQALSLKELGFDEPCLGWFMKINPLGKEFLPSIMFDKVLNQNQVSVFGDKNCSAPLKQQVFRWFRENHKIEAVIACFYSKRLGVSYKEREYHCHIIRDGITTKGPKYKTHENAESACIDKLIEIVKNK